MSNSNPLIDGIPLDELLSLALGPVLDRIAVSPFIANKFLAADTTERYCHIEWTDPTAPILWRIDDWRVSDARVQRRKALADRTRAIEVRSTELRAELSRGICRQTQGGPEQVEAIVCALIRQRNVTAATFYGCDITELLALDDELARYKIEQGIK